MYEKKIIQILVLEYSNHKKYLNQNPWLCLKNEEKKNYTYLDMFY